MYDYALERTISRARAALYLLDGTELDREAEALEDMREDRLHGREHGPTVAIGGEAVQHESSRKVRYA